MLRSFPPRPSAQAPRPPDRPDPGFSRGPSLRGRGGAGGRGRRARDVIKRRHPQGGLGARPRIWPALRGNESEVAGGCSARLGGGSGSPTPRLRSPHPLSVSAGARPGGRAGGRAQHPSLPGGGDSARLLAAALRSRPLSPPPLGAGPRLLRVAAHTASHPALPSPLRTLAVPPEPRPRP